MLQARPRLLIAITVLVFGGGSALVGYEVSRPPARTGFSGVSPAPEVQDGVMTLFGEDRCVAADAAASQVRAKLDALGRSDWAVIHGPGAQGATCVGAAIDAEARQVVLLMALEPQTREGLDAVAERLLQECRSKDEAVQMVKSALEGAGADAWELRTDGSRSYGPSDRIDEINRHVEQGCWIYSGTGWTADGTRIYWVGGK